MRKITHLVVHCTASPASATKEGILNYWRETRGWNVAGYHVLIEASGLCHRLVPNEHPSNGVRGHNAHSLHVSYIGGIDAKGKPKDTRTPQQKRELLRILRAWKQAHPKAVIVGHRDFPNVQKACPSFDARKEYAHL
ncbi:N-acetylmuramoyl-L-alanine amidase [Hymenobacter sp. BT175]|uniref:N-acetylmuramoyl-L-alanine amidase n=1 Tax=Hymenobacter translucens TaxID=2886507 RepID=UPI001D0F4225|nr:N-acetylmuramoyl-L-alanine amidase [Hymenobacter translucens]MCC2547734.1 N-acetylmuramoyl-L-alanine amidase [Hymenobacter translucens]